MKNIYGSQIRRRFDLILILAWPALASLLSFWFQTSFFTSLLLFLGFPSLYLSYRVRDKNLIGKIAVFAAILGVPLAIVIDYIMQRTGGWFLPQSIFGFRLFEYATVEQIFWLFFYIYFVVMFYEIFFDKDQQPRLFYPNLKYLLLITGGILAIFLLIYGINQDFLLINYFYLKFGIILGLVPICCGLWKAPSVYKKFLLAGAYFFVFSLIYELTALRLGHWTFPAKDQFIGFMKIFNLHFPFEEFFFWILLGAIIVLSYYELFDDDKK